MDIYRQKSRWKLYLAVAGLLIVVGSALYTRNLTQRLAREEHKKVELWFRAQESLLKPLDETCLGCEDFTLETEILKSNTTLPLILVSETGEIISAFNFGEERDTNKIFLRKQLDKLIASGSRPIEGFGQKIYYQNSRLLTEIKYLPIIQLLLIGFFVFIGYLGFSSARKAEQNRVWVGMAKETAHQLGTPLSAIFGWLEYLKEMKQDDEELNMVVEELTKDANKLHMVAERFSKIGAIPELHSHNIYDPVRKTGNYLRERAPAGIQLHFPEGEETPVYAMLNPPLFEWVLENLLRNAIDAMQGKGDVKLSITSLKDKVLIEVSDTGKGMHADEVKHVFKPGFSTKDRGWGLGLSLAHRIIAEYHGGRIYVKHSEPGKGTTFAIELPLSKETTNRTS